jgi:predicted phosphohydrolase
MISGIKRTEETQMIYNYVDANMPEWARESVQWAVDNGIVKGEENGLNLDDKDLKYIVMLHYPPTNEKFQESDFTQIFKEYNVEKVIYGHLHGNSLGKILNGHIEGIEYIMTAADYLNFCPIKILED